MISTYSHAIGSIISAAFVMVFTQQENIIEPIVDNWVWLLALIVFGILHQIALTKACELETNPSNVAIICSSDVVIIYFLNVAFMGVELNFFALLGSFIVMVSIIVLLKSKSPPVNSIEKPSEN